ncbi:hypothetical protein PybrP1_002089 [[Pythium] brassicae (nom. inval.)]|nr:hypothetical protein PybrP1_002089 [[Pythium] brassicae (nom. inval.)]
MELIQSSFQASFDARVERVNATELAELRTIFRFFDTDSDGAVSADQACRMFALLGLDVNPMYVQDLEEVYLNGESSEPMAQVALDEDELRKRNEQLWEDEWKLVDSHRRGFTTLHELRLFLANCGSATPVCDLLRFVEMYGDPAATLSTRDGDGDDRTIGSQGGSSDGNDVFVLTKAGFLKFRREYTDRDLQGSDQGLSSGDEDDDDEDPSGETAVQRDVTAQGGVDADVLKRTSSQRRPQSQRNTTDEGDGANSDDASSTASSRRHGLIVVDPGVIDASHFDVEEDEDDDEADAMSQHSEANSSGISVGLLADEFADE